MSTELVCPPPVVVPWPSLERAKLLRYARDTWTGLVAAVDPTSGLPADCLRIDASLSAQTSISDIGALLWSILVAQRLGLIDRAEAIGRAQRLLNSLAQLERDPASGSFFNWYDHVNGAILARWPGPDSPFSPALSSVDNGWLATGLRIIARGLPELAAPAEALFAGIDFGAYYRPAQNQIAIVIDRTNCYDTIISESRIATYLGIAAGRIPARAYFGTCRTLPAERRQQAVPLGARRRYLETDVFEGAYAYAGLRLVPSWGGSMFEALMPTLFVPEERWGARSWGHNHPLTVAAQIHYGLIEQAQTCWGVSASSTPGGRYDEYGVGPIGMNPEGHSPEGVVTPHASFLALRYAPAEALANLERLERDFGAYDDWGFADSVNVRSGKISNEHFIIDSGMIMAALGNALDDDLLRRSFAYGDISRALRPIMALEKFNFQG